MNINNCEITILVKGRPITEFFHRGQTFVEGRGNSNYEIAFRNYNPFKVEVVLSVDGLSVTDGKTAGPQSSGYVVEANGTLTVPGWTLDNAAVAAFAFAESKGGSYVEQSTGSSANKGVIGALVYKEMVAAYTPPPYWTAMPYNGYPGGIGVMRQMSSNMGVSSNSIDPVGGASFEQKTSGGMLYNTMNVSAASASAASPYAETSMRTPGGYVSEINQVEQTLGTAFGEQTSFNTHTVSFARGDHISMMVIYYDDAKGLAARGIQFQKRVRPTTPQAFPGMNPPACVPPPGWKG